MKFPEDFRWQNAPAGFSTRFGEPFGFFLIPGRHACGRLLKVMAVDGEETGWEHVSVSLQDRPNKSPSWDEMCVVKDLFWDADEVVVQFHPAKSDYVNYHAGCLHLWNAMETGVGPFPTPPSILVGPSAVRQL